MTRTSNGPEPTTGHDCRLDRLCPIHRAAPELLASCREWLDLWNWIDEHYPEIELPMTLQGSTDACGRLRAAITKAGGQ